MDIGDLANGFGLLQLPKMPELKGKVIDKFHKTDVDLKSIPYLDKAREKQRQQKLKEAEGERKEEKKMNDKFKNKSWSKEKDKKIKKQMRKEKKKELKRKRCVTGHKFDDDEVDELAKEVRLMKKLKRGKISKDQFDIAVKDEEDLDEESKS